MLGSMIGGGLTNSGTMPIAGGAATSGNGDSIFKANGKQGGLNYTKGISNTTLVIAAICAAAALFLLKNNAKN
jgi:hypothetical protein